MKVVIIYDRDAEQGSLDQRDVLSQADAIRNALSDLGHESETLTFSLDLRSFKQALRALSPGLVFNLVESVEGNGRLLYLATSILDSVGVPYTGSPTDTLYLTTNKLLTKRIFSWASIPTPGHFTVDYLKGTKGRLEGDFLIKSVWEHASIGLDEDSVFSSPEPERLLSEIERRKEMLGGECFVEKYIEGREFNLSILASHYGPEILPPAEIQFVDYPPEKWKVVGYRAKWAEDSFEYQSTVRNFKFLPDDEPLLSELKKIARQCWSLFSLRGYGRVDFRVDQGSRPWVLEINANPCLSPDAGFFAAATKAGLTYKEIVKRIIEDKIAT